MGKFPRCRSRLTGRRKPSQSSLKRGQNLFGEKPHLVHERFIGGIDEPKIEIVGPGIDELLDPVADLGRSADDRRFDAGRGRLFDAFGLSPRILTFAQVAGIARHVGLILRNPFDIFPRLFHGLSDTKAQLEAPIEMRNIPARFPGAVAEISNHCLDDLRSHHEAVNPAIGMVEGEFHRRPFLSTGERVATDPYRDAAGRLGVDNQIVEVDVLAMERGAGLFPYLPHRADVFADHGVPIGVRKKGHSDGLVFFFVRNVRYPDAKNEATARECVHRGKLFCEDDRLAQRQRHDAHSELNSSSHASEKRTNRDRLKLMRLKRIVRVPVRAHPDGILFMPIEGVVNMVHDPDRIVTETLGLPGRFNHPLAAAYRSRSRDSRAESDSWHTSSLERPKINRRSCDRFLYLLCFESVKRALLSVGLTARPKLTKGTCNSRGPRLMRKTPASLDVTRIG